MGISLNFYDVRLLCRSFMATAQLPGLLYKDCEEFDTSRSRGPFSFKLDGGQVIKGWDSGEQLPLGVDIFGSLPA